MTNPVSSVADAAERQCAQRSWAMIPVVDRLRVLRRARSAMAQISESFADAVSPQLSRTPADTRVAEIMPLLAACKFLERSAGKILQVRRLGRRGLPFWLTGVHSEVQRVPLGTVLIIGPSNYPLFLPGVQALQALAAGNAVVWKPGRGGKRVAELFASAMIGAGLPRGLLQVTEDSIEASQFELRGSVDKVVFTGSAESGRAVLRATAQRLIPSVVEASGCDAVVVLPSADLERVVKALVFGMRLNGSATCMAPRRVLVVGRSSDKLVQSLAKAFAAVSATHVRPALVERLKWLIAEAEANGAKVIGKLDGEEMRPILVTHANPSMELARSDLFAPVLSVMEVANVDEVLIAQDSCPFALTAAIFGEEAEARSLAGQLNVGTVLINDLVVSTADPRVPFGGRKLSGFGATRGAEGLLEMTAIKVISARRGAGTRQYEPTDSSAHIHLFDGLISATHSSTWGQRWHGLQKIVRAARGLNKSERNRDADSPT